jgi:hypothetical protein
LAFLLCACEHRLKGRLEWKHAKEAEEEEEEEEEDEEEERVWKGFILIIMGDNCLISLCIVQ